MEWFWPTLAGAACLIATGFALAWWKGTQTSRRSQRERSTLQDLAKNRLRRPSVFSHEVRTPLALIRGAAELLAEETPGPLNEWQSEFVATIIENCTQVIAMAEDLLAEAKLESQLFSLRLEKTDLRQLTRGTVRELRRIHSCPIQLDNHGAPLRLDVDPGLIRQALWNLVNNAARHSGKGITITVRVNDTHEGALISVSDNGAGISQEDKAQLFTPFAVSSSMRPGSGLGMMITEKIVEVHGGRILVDTVARRGTTIFINLPNNETLAARRADDK